MSIPLNPGHFAAAPRPNPRPRSVRPTSINAVKWGWLEWFLIAQTFLPALLFLPGISAIRTPIRVASFGVGLLAWATVVQSGRTRPGATTFSANFWLRIVCCWLILLIFNPDTNSLLAGFAHALLYISILSPAFWTHSTVVTHRQLGRVMAILFLCNGLSAMVGIGQVFRPGTFNPPVIPALADPNSLSALALTYDDAHGNRIARPCGLTDQLGGASGAGATAALVGLAFALRPIGVFKRLACLVIAFFGFAVIYYSQVRMILLMLVICLATLVFLFFLQKNYAQATLLGGISAGLIAVSFLWVAATSGQIVVDRFLVLFAEDPLTTYNKARGGYVQQAFEQFLWQFPIGAGLGWWGQIYQFFGDKTVPTTIWVEVMWPAWIIDGGIPLLVAYLIAIGLAMYDSCRIALTTKNRELGFWAAVIVASNLSILATCFSYVTFVASIGMQFWFLAAALHAAEIRSKDELRALSAQARRGSSTHLRPVTPPNVAPGPFAAAPSTPASSVGPLGPGVSSSEGPEDRGTVPRVDPSPETPPTA